MSDPRLDDDAFDARFAGLGPVEPPAAVVDATLARVAALRAEEASANVVPLRPSPRRWLLAGGTLFAAAAGWLLLPAPPQVADPSALVAKGAGEVAPTLDLRAVVRTAAGRTERVTPGGRYAPGDTLHFRVSASERMKVQLRRDDTVIWSGEIGPDPVDLPAGWQVEAGERPGRFVLEGAGASVELPFGGGTP